MGIPQIIMIIFFAMDLGINLAKHGEDKKGKYNIWVALICALIEFFILYCGGFFSK